MLSFIQRYLRFFYILLPVFLGMSLGHFAATGLGVYLRPPPQFSGGPADSAPVSAEKQSLKDFEIILARNIFDSSAQQQEVAFTSEEPKESAPPSAPPQSRQKLDLLGTVVAGEDSLALVRSGKETDIFHLGDEIPGGGKLREISRNTVTVEYQDGSTASFTLYSGDQETGQPPAAAPPPRRTSQAASAQEGIREVGENQYVLDREEVEKARSNMNELLKQARLEPMIVNGATEGFVVRMVRPRSLIAMLGIQRGDVIMEVNDVSLDSPEKALQIFQQLREARNISIGLTRGGEKINFQYQIN